MTKNTEAINAANNKAITSDDAVTSPIVPNYREAKMVDIIVNAASNKLAVNENRCLLVRNRNAECLKCAGVCTTGAISINEEGVVVSPDLCIGCGTCASACPSNCLSAANPTDESLSQTIKECISESCGKVVIMCESAYSTAFKKERAADTQASSPFAAGNIVAIDEDGTKVIGVVCLGRIDESLILEATARAAKSIHLIMGNCVSCDHKNGGQLCRQIVKTAENLLGAVGACPSIRIIDVTSDNNLTLKRIGAAYVCDKSGSDLHSVNQVKCNDAEVEKNLAQATRDEHNHLPTGARTALSPGYKKDFTSKFMHVGNDKTLPHFLPPRRLRIFNSLKQLWGNVASRDVETRLWGKVTIDTELCCSCRMCTVFCPTGALARYGSSEDSFGVEHCSALCVQCNLCKTICPEKAIEINSRVDLAEIISGNKEVFAMQPLGWNPGKEDSIASRMARFVKVDNLQEPQAKVKSNDTALRREYAQKREARRAEIRSAKK